MTAPADGAVEGPDGAFTFGVLGPLEVVGGDGPVTVTGARRRTLLLMLLLAANRPTPMVRLTENLWEGDPPPGAASTFRSHLSRLRQVVGPDRLHTRHGNVVLLVRPGELDAEAFDADVAAARRAVADGDVVTGEALFRQGLDRWRGPALADAAGSAWAVPEVARLEEQHLGALEGALDARLLLGRHQQVMAEVEAAVAEHPLREHLWEILMLALYRSGRQSDALRAFQRLRAHLDEEVGVEPSPAVTVLEGQILRQDPALDWTPGDTGRPAGRPAPTSPAPAPAPAVARPQTTGPGGPLEDQAFVGRDDELDALRHARDRALANAKVLAVVSGEPGIGKSRLAAEFAVGCADQGDLVLTGGWDEQMRSAFQGLRQAFGGLAGRHSELLLPGLLDRVAGPLAQILPELWGNAGAEEPAARVGDAEQFQAFESFVALVRTLTEARPLVVVLDDLQWADSSSLSLLEHLLGSDADVSLLIVATLRNTQPATVDGLDNRLVGLRRRLYVERVDLGGLSPDSALGLLASTIGAHVDLDHHERSALRDYTGGNPFFIQELALDLAAEGPIDGTSFVRAASGRDSVPERLQELVRWRLSKLSTACKEVLAVGATMGIEFEAGVVGEVAGVDEDGLLSLLDEAMTASVVREVAGSPDCYRFSHDLVRQSLDAGLGTSRQIRLHLRIARAMEARDGHRPVRAAEIGHHFALGAPAGGADRAVHHLRRAGHEAVRRLAYGDAVELLGQALELAQTYDPEDVAGVGALLLDLADALVKSGRLVEADERYTQAFSAGSATADLDLMAGAALGYGGVIPAGSEPNPTAERLLQTTLKALAPDTSRTRALVLGRLAQWGHFSRDREERRRMADAAVREASEIDDATLAACLEYRYWALCGPDDVDDQIRSARRIRAIGEALEEPELVLRGMKCELHTEFERGDLEAAGAIAVAMRRLATDIRQPEYLRLVHMWDSLVAGIRGRFDDAERHAQEAFAIMRLSGHSQADTITVGLSLTWLWLRGRMEELAPMLEQGATGRSSLGELALTVWIASEIGQEEVARTTLELITPEMVRAQDRNFHWWLLMGGMGNAVCNLGDRAWARVLYDVMAPYGTHFVRAGQATFLGSAALYLGRLATTAGDPAVGLGHLEQALTVHRAMGAGPFVDLTTRAVAEAAARVGESAAAD